MALQGTIETFALPEVLRLLGSAAKTGRLRLSGDRGSGSVWLDGGKVVGAEATGLREDTPPVSVVFELIRFTHGSFSFDDDQTNTRPGTPQDIEVLLGEAERRLADWQEIEAVIPSRSVRLTLADDLPAPELVIDAHRWRAIVAVARGGTAGAIGDALALDEFEGCRRAKDLVEEGLVQVVETPAEPGTDEVSAPVEAASVEAAPVEAAPVEAATTEPWGVPEPAVEATNGYDHGLVDPGAAGGLGDGAPLGSSPAVAEPAPAEPRYATEPSPSPEASSGPAPIGQEAWSGQEAWPGPEAWPVEDAPVGHDSPPPADAGFADTAPDPGYFGPPVVADEPSSARAELDAMASGFGLADSAPTPDYGFEPGLEQGFASDPSEDPAFSFAAPDGGADHGGFRDPDGGRDAPAPMAPGAALFADDVVSAPAAAEPVAMGGGDLFAPGTAVFDPTTPDDAGDAAEVARQLANLSPKAARAVAAAARATTVEEREAALAEVTAEGDQPINRGLLLKFLSSAQT